MRSSRMRGLYLVACLLGTTALTCYGAKPSRAVIEQHLDRSVEVYGRYAAVRLPIHKGVRVWNPTAIRVSPRGEVFVANYTGEIYRIIDTDGDGLEDTAVLFCNVKDAGLRCPTTMAFRGQDLYVGVAQEIRVYEDRDNDGVAERSRTFVEFPCNEHPFYWTFGLCWGPDGHLYVNLATDSYNPNPAADPGGWRGSLLRIAPDGSDVQRFATGLRFAPGLAFHRSGILFFTDNEGGGNPTEELNVAVRDQFYGHNPDRFAPHGPGMTPMAALTCGRGVSGITFNSLDNDFGAADDLFVVFWGARQITGDGSIARVKLWREEENWRAREIPFCSSLDKPFDLAFGPSGDLYVTQFGPVPLEMTPSTVATGAVYRFIPASWFRPSYQNPPTFPLVRGNVEHGKKLFVRRGCSRCHALDGGTELLGPNLVRLGDRFDYAAAMGAIREPSQSIRSGFESEIVETQDGEFVEGRIVTSDLKQLTLMVPGNQLVTLSRAAIRGHRPSRISLMPEGLVADLKNGSLRDLCAYLGIQERPFRVRWRYRIVVLGMLIATVIFTSWCLKRALMTT
jgi:putative heme-binding domain-containing protein